MDPNTRTHKNEDPISIFLPSVDHLVILFLCSLGVYGEERPRAVTKIGLSLQRLILCRPRVAAVAIAAICYCIVNSEFSKNRLNLRETVTLTWVIALFDVSVGSL